MKICDLTQFYSPLSGGVKRYVHEKIRYIQRSTDDEHVLIIPGPKTEMIEAERSRIYSIRSPLLSRTSRYRALLNLRAIEEIMEREQPRPDRVGRSVSGGVESDRFRGGAADPGGRFLSFTFSRSLSAHAARGFWAEPRPSS